MERLSNLINETNVKFNQMNDCLILMKQPSNANELNNRLILMKKQTYSFIAQLLKNTPIKNRSSSLIKDDFV